MNKMNTVDVGSARLGQGGEAPARAYYIGPWGDQMSVFAAKMDRQLDENETRMTGGPIDEGSGVSGSSQRSLTDKNANGSAPDVEESGSMFPDIHRGKFTDPGH
jgi:hypothetical protein